MERLCQIPQLKDVRGRGLMIGMEIDGPAAELRKRLLFEKRIFTGGAGVSTVRLLPALSVARDHADRLIESLIELL